MLRTRAQMLTGEDKVLVEMYLEGSSVGEMACLAGVNAETISRRVCKLMRRLLRSEYIMCFRNRRYLSRAEQAIAKDYFIDGRSQRSIALSRDVSLYKVRKALRRMRMLMNREKKGK
jgi:DNA-directed RNA polymerase specialized sigma24 family protein